MYPNNMPTFLADIILGRRGAGHAAAGQDPTRAGIWFCNIQVGALGSTCHSAAHRAPTR